MLLTPLEQFQIISIFSIKLVNFDLSITNVFIINGVITVLICLFILFSSNFSKYNHINSFFLIPNPWQYVIEVCYGLVSDLLFDNLNEEGEKYFPFVVTIFLFILLNNLIGLVPYSFTITSHLIITFSLSCTVFIGVNIIAFNHHKENMISLFIPANTSFFLALILVPIEFVSYIAKPISLGVRLFINLMAGHTLLKVIVGFSWSILLLENTTSFIQVMPLLILVVLMGLELGVALIQAYVFIVLTCIYLNDSINLH